MGAFVTIHRRAFLRIATIGSAATNITDVSRGASETGSAFSQVFSSAKSLSTESNHLKVEVNRFLATVRAA